MPERRRQADNEARFVAAARELGCDENEARFNAALGKIARAKPADPPARKPKPAKTKPGQ